jgi:hypothetical protein
VSRFRRADWGAFSGTTLKPSDKTALGIKIQGYELFFCEAPFRFRFFGVDGDGRQSDHRILAQDWGADDKECGTVLEKEPLLLDLFAVNGLDHQVIVGEIIIPSRGRVDCQNLAMLVHDTDLKRTHAAQFNDLGLDFTQDGFDARHISFEDWFTQRGTELIQDAFHFLLKPVGGAQRRGLAGEQQQDRTYQQQPTVIGQGIQG